MYLREWKVNELDAVLIKIYRCLKCSRTGNFQLKRHLESQRSCFAFYLQRFDVLDWNQLNKKLSNLVKPSQASRSQFRRRLENAEMLRKKRNAKTITDSLNSFNMETSLSCYRLWNVFI